MSVDEAIGALSNSYSNILKEFIKFIHEVGESVLRLLPVSSSTFAGKFAGQMPAITMKALFRAFGRVSAPTSSFQVHLCLYRHPPIGMQVHQSGLVKEYMAS
jgi:hypothetical protein